MLSSQEQHTWDDVVRYWSQEADEPPRCAAGGETAPADQAHLPIAVVAGAWITITLIVLGVMSAALTVGVTTALAWTVRPHWPRLSGRRTPDPATGRRWLSD